MLFLGTGASESIPNPFCTCRVCEYALHSSDQREKRHRSAFLIDEKTIIDFGPDVLYACIQFGVSLSSLHNIFLTHLHSDHWDISTLENMLMSITEPPHVRIFLSHSALNGLNALNQMAASLPLASYQKHKKKYQERCEFIAVEPYKTLKVDDLLVSPLKTTHPGCFTDETALNYLFTRNGTTLLYASDTGVYPEENFEFLQQKKINILILEGTFGGAEYADHSRHLNCETAAELINRLRKIGCVEDSTQIWITHISHKGRLTHMEYEQQIKKLVGQQASAAYDGMPLRGL